MKILIVDDEIFARKTLERLLSGYDDVEIIEAEDCYDAYTMYQEFHPDVVITDILMKGGIGGEWLIEKILGTDKNARIIVCSGRPRTELLKFKLMGAKQCIQKPVKYQELWDAINEIM
ncbi:MAG: response regulator [Pseudobutyrivibrio sp.]|nr:response regulator [Pseudobutyrivibrio sp.]